MVDGTQIPIYITGASSDKPEDLARLFEASFDAPATITVQVLLAVLVVHVTYETGRSRHCDV